MKSPRQPILTRGFFILWLVGFSSYASVYLLVPVLPLYLQQRGASTAAIGSLLGLMSLAALFTRPFSGWLSDGWGRRPLIAIGLAAMLVFAVGLPFLASALLFGLLRLVSGVGWGCLTSNANTLAGEMAPPGRQGEAIGLYTMAGSVAFAGSPAVGLFLMGRYGYDAAFWTAAALTALALVLALCLTQPRRVPLRPFNLANLVSRNALGPAGVIVLHAMTYGGLVFFLPLLARERHLGDPGLFFTIYALALVVLRGIAGRLSDRFGRPAVIGPGIAMGGLGLLVLAFATARWQMLGAAVLFAFSMGFVQPPSLAWGLDLDRERRGTAMATMVAAQDMGLALGGTVLGTMGTLGGLGALFGGAAGLSALALVGLVLLARRGAGSDRT
ncbi:MAG: MFS transporter [Armatimonadota bacterium]|nr:MFS transporter [Armatimonadota bacterium]